MLTAELDPPVANVGRPMREKLAGFARTLRDNGFKVGLAETRDALAILTHSPASRPTSLRPAFRSLFCATYSDWKRFDEILDAYWLGAGMHQLRALSAVAAQSQISVRRRTNTTLLHGLAGQPDHVERRNEGDGQSAADGRARREGASRSENLASTDFRHITDMDMAKAHALAERLARVMRARLVRREQIRRCGRRLDLRRTIHRNVSHGGTPVDLAWRRRKIKPLRLVVLLDASSSMNLYTAFFVRFLHGVVDAFREAEA